MNELQDFEKLVADFSKIKIKERGLTFLEIAKTPNLEIVWTNILAFYLNPNNEHQLSDLLLKSILGEDFVSTNYNNISVNTEHRTQKNNRIDILVSNDDFILGIENKVDASLYNDLEDYSKTIENLAKPRKLTYYQIILSKYPCDPSFGFKNILYADFVKNLKNNLGKYTYHADSKYLLFLLDFIKNIENSLNAQNMNDNLEVVKFFHDNVVQINALMKQHHKLNDELIGRLNYISQNLKIEVIESKLRELDFNSKFTGAGPNDKSRFKYGDQLAAYRATANEISIVFHISVQDYQISIYYYIEKYPNNKELNDKLFGGAEKAIKIKYNLLDVDLVNEIRLYILNTISFLDSTIK